MAWQNPKTNWQAGNVPTAADFNRIEGNEEQLKQDLDSHKNASAPHSGHETPSGAQSKVTSHANSKQTHGASGSYYIAKTSRSDQLPAWGDVQGKPSTYPPSSHNHDDRYYTESESNDRFEYKLASNRKRQIFVQSGTPSGASTGDLWIW